MKLLAASAGNSTPLLELEFYFTAENECGDIISFEGIDGEVFACHHASCRPPTSGGTGGSLPKGSSGGGASSTTGDGSYKVGGSISASDIQGLKGAEAKTAGEIVNANGTLSQAHMNPDGTFNFSEAEEKRIAAGWEGQGLNREEMIENAMAAALSAISRDTAGPDSVWYSFENEEWAQPLSEATGMSVEAIFAATSVTSALRRWPENKVVVERLIKKLADDEPFEVTQKMADEYNKYNGKAKFGVTELQPGMYKPSDMSSAVMARLATGLGWKVANLIGTRPVFQAIAVLRGEVEPNQLIHGPKQRSFYSNLAHPEVSYSVTNDFWAARALVGTGTLRLPDNGVDAQGNKLNTSKGATREVTMRDWETTITGYNTNRNGEREPVRGNIANAIFKNSVLYADATRITVQALDRLAQTDVRFRGMKPHEFQALLWVNQQREYDERGWT